MDVGFLVFGLAGLLTLVCFMPPLAGRVSLGNLDLIEDEVEVGADHVKALATGRGIGHGCRRRRYDRRAGNDHGQFPHTNAGSRRESPS